MTESIFDSADGTQGGQSSHGSDVDAGYESEGGADDTAAGSVDGAEVGSGDSHAADVDAGYDDASNGSAAGDNGLDLG